MEGFLLGFGAGYLLGSSTGGSSSTRTISGHPVSQRYALFTPKTGEEALKELQQAYESIYSTGQVLPQRFDDDGDLVSIVTNEGEEPFEDTDDTINLEEFPRALLLTIELFNKDMSPIGENLMLARYLSKQST